MFKELIAEAREPWRAAPFGGGKPPIIGYLADAVEQLGKELEHWKNNHETEVRRARILKERTDMPVERTEAYRQWGKDLAELRACKLLIADLSLRLASAPTVPEETGFC